MASLLSLAVSLQLVAIVASNPVTPIPPTITQPARLRRQDPDSPGWVGWLIESTSGSRSLNYNNCGDDHSFYISSTFAECCLTTDDDWESSCTQSMITGCSGNVISYDGTTQDCNANSHCSPDTVFTGSTQDAFGILWYGCNSASQRLYYQQEPLENEPGPTTSDSPSSVSESSASTTTSASSISQETSSSPTPDPEPDEEEGSKAWIAGAVVGPIALIAIAGLAFFLIRRRKRSKDPAYQAAPQMTGAYPQQPPPGNPQQQQYQGYPPQGYNGEPQQPYYNGYAAPSQDPYTPSLAAASPAPGHANYSNEHKGYYGHHAAPQDTHWGPDGAPSNAAAEMPGSEVQPSSPRPVSELPSAADPQPQSRSPN